MKKDLKSMKNLSAYFIIVMMLSACSYDNLEELHPVCDSTVAISFAGDILPIFTGSCGAGDFNCHQTDASESGYGLETYDEVILTIDNSGNFLKTIKHDQSISSSKWMPRNAPKLDGCTILKIEAWINRGRLEN